MSGVADIGGVKLLRSWADVIRHAASPSWENVRLEAANNFRLNLQKLDQKLPNTWNERVAVVKLLADALANDKVSEGLDPAHVDAIREEARWDIRHLCMECEYLDDIEPEFHHALAFYYVSGHFPCGVEGHPASGTMIVY